MWNVKTKGMLMGKLSQIVKSPFTDSDICREQIKSDKSPKEITSEIQAIMRQITASVTFLPILNEPCCFDLLVYADKEATVPLLWEDSDPCLIQNGEQVKMRSFTTKVSKFVFEWSCFNLSSFCL
jgi:hypothetical protein